MQSPHSANKALMVTLIISTALVAAVAIFPWIPAYVSFGGVVALALSWCYWLERHPTDRRDAATLSERVTFVRYLCEEPGREVSG